MKGFLGDDPFDLADPADLVLAAGSGLLDDERRCRCTCDCERIVEWPDDECDACRDGRHRDPFDTADRR
jgi:hypothetical protein